MRELEWVDLDSTAVSGAAYDAETEFIYIRFPSGASYVYEECPPHIWEAFMEPSQSAGKHFNATIKDKPCHKLDI